VRQLQVEFKVLADQEANLAGIQWVGFGCASISVFGVPSSFPWHSFSCLFAVSFVRLFVLNYAYSVLFTGSQQCE